MEKTTCQVCGREIKTINGLVAHHGYRRPFAGVQTASCPGAKYAPYEVSCDRLREMVEVVKHFIVSQEEALAAFLAMPPQTITVVDRRSSFRPGTEVVYQKPEPFDKKSYRSCIPRTYENAYATRKAGSERAIQADKEDLSTMERRLNEWKAIEVDASFPEQ